MQMYVGTSPISGPNNSRDEQVDPGKSPCHTKPRADVVASAEGSQAPAGWILGQTRPVTHPEACSGRRPRYMQNLHRLR